VQKTSDFLKFMACQRGQGEIVSVRTRGKAGVNFSRLSEEIFYGRSLTKLNI